MAAHDHPLVVGHVEGKRWSGSLEPEDERAHVPKSRDDDPRSFALAVGEENPKPRDSAGDFDRLLDNVPEVSLTRGGLSIPIVGD